MNTNKKTTFEDFLTDIYLSNVENTSIDAISESYFAKLSNLPQEFNVKSIAASHILPEKIEDVDIDDKIEKDWLQTFKNIKKELLNVENACKPEVVMQTTHSTIPLFFTATAISLALAIAITVYAPDQTNKLIKTVDNIMFNSGNTQNNISVNQASDYKNIDSETKVKYILENKNRLKNTNKNSVSVSANDIFGQVAGVEEVSEEKDIQDAYNKVLAEQDYAAKTFFDFIINLFR